MLADKPSMPRSVTCALSGDFCFIARLYLLCAQREVFTISKLTVFAAFFVPFDVGRMSTKGTRCSFKARINAERCASTLKSRHASPIIFTTTSAFEPFRAPRLSFSTECAMYLDAGLTRCALTRAKVGVAPIQVATKTPPSLGTTGTKAVGATPLGTASEVLHGSPPKVFGAGCTDVPDVRSKPLSSCCSTATETSSTMLTMASCPSRANLFERSASVADGTSSPAPCRIKVPSEIRQVMNMFVNFEISRRIAGRASVPHASSSSEHAHSSAVIDSSTTVVNDFSPLTSVETECNVLLDAIRMASTRMASKSTRA
mmetsp:Transcript_2126/g.8303  ORF Transcript_2126/g.8303 Transcript_2126/m.8303 type:complete len:315 (-) Transcript_2126:580-1524(-)